jgi:hypothetical protein
MHQWKVPLKYRGMLSFPSGPLGQGQAADTMVWGGYLRNGGNKNLRAHTNWSYIGIQRGCLILLQKHPLVATATAIAAARHSPLATTTTTAAPWLHRHRLRRHRIIIGTAITTVFPPSSCPLPSIVVRYSSFFTHFITISPLIPLRLLIVVSSGRQSH